MTWALTKKACAVVSCTMMLAGCGMKVPEYEPLSPSPRTAAIFTNRIANYVRCELREAVHDGLNTYGAGLSWLKDWSAKATLKITIEEKSSISPGLTFNQVLPAAITRFVGNPPVSTQQSSAVALGATAGSTGTRVDTTEFFFVFRELLAERQLLEQLGRPTECIHLNGIAIEGDLRIADKIHNMALVSRTPYTVSRPFKTGGPLNTASHQISFVVTAAGNVTPTWRLVEVTANPAGPFLSGTRTRTDDLLVTFGPIAELKPGRAVRPSAELEDAHLAERIGQAVSSAINRQP